MLKKILYPIKSNRNQDFVCTFKEKQLTPFLSFILSGRKTGRPFIQNHGFRIPTSISTGLLNSCKYLKIPYNYVSIIIIFSQGRL